MERHASPAREPAVARVRLGVLTNPQADRNQLSPVIHKRLLDHLASAADGFATPSESQIDQAVRHLLVDQGVTVLGINGGDGTIHGVLNALLRLLGDDVAAGRARLPTLLFLNGGTYNMASRAMGTKGDPVATVRRFQQRYRDKPLTDLATRRVPLLEVRPANRDPEYGMVFGSQVVADVLDLCDTLGAGYLGLASLLVQGTMGALFKAGFFRRNAWRLRPEDSRVWVDGQLIPDASAVVASTIDMKLARGLVWALTTSPSADGFHVKLVRSKGATEVVRLLPNLLWELPHPMIVARPEAGRLISSGRFTLDGELYRHEGRVEVVLAPFSFDAVSGEAFT
jgi:hypothetical protein